MFFSLSFFSLRHRLVLIFIVLWLVLEIVLGNPSLPFSLIPCAILTILSAIISSTRTSSPFIKTKVVFGKIKVKMVRTLYHSQGYPFGHAEIQNDRDGTKFVVNGQRLKHYMVDEQHNQQQIVTQQ
ncbi:hypothetical protein PIB30_080856 [Stylosanthes scabra]|uniref:Uncharacterized protein n=1 Tax=Stylosanthes scabra TaxID=79078 RepID=A0ABU6VSK8_9FABA|nr:hypothetical protein [Stylosanthes scabra]